MAKNSNESAALHLHDVNVRSKGTTVHFMMQEKSDEETVHFDGNPSSNYIDSYFETKCGGVYKWWI